MATAMHHPLVRRTNWQTKFKQLFELALHRFKRKSNELYTHSDECFDDSGELASQGGQVVPYP